MLLRLILIFTLIPIIELALLIELGLHIGLELTLAIVIVTGVIGAYLARHEGFKVIHRIRQELGAGRLPAEEWIDGIIILAGGLLLLTPGLLTDALGLLALIPVTRRYLKGYLKRKFKQKIASNQIHTFYTIDHDSVS